MNTSLSKARAGVFLLLVAISVYSLFMIMASNTSYAEGKGLFRFSSLIGLSPGANSYDKQEFKKSLADNLISTVDSFTPSDNVVVGVVAFNANEVAEFLSSPRKSTFRRNHRTGSSEDSTDRNGIILSNLLLPFSGASAGINSGLVSECIKSLQADPDTEELIVEEVIACIINPNGNGNLLADEGTGSDPFGNGDNGIDDIDDEDMANGGGNGSGGSDDPNGNGGNNGEGENGNNGEGPIVLAQVPEPSTYMLLGLGMITLVGFSRKKVQARIL